MRKTEEINDPTSCLNKAGYDEPIFVIRAKDPVAPLTIRAWAEASRLAGLHETKKIEDAEHQAKIMDAWRIVHIEGREHEHEGRDGLPKRRSVRR